ncbi:UNKNOWN [Stylonychia lemnae]|uniref:Uncharacterized protein n=1 Tax=Stylonychia lemnae TaxID=5949 RepID=A0A078AML8_STYLE|nr:UNKNOWN [Stylonychia lemnae]|eukprot:CDW83394.1 UNKNOWN [Stylonychia lemnae]
MNNLASYQIQQQQLSNNYNQSINSAIGHQSQMQSNGISVQTKFKSNKGSIVSNSALAYQQPSSSNSFSISNSLGNNQKANKNLKKAIQDIYERNNSHQQTMPSRIGLPSALDNNPNNQILTPQQLILRNQKRSQSVEKNVNQQVYKARLQNQKLNLNQTQNLSFKLPEKRRIEKFSSQNTVEKKRNKSSDKANTALNKPFQQLLPDDYQIEDQFLLIQQQQLQHQQQIDINKRYLKQFIEQKQKRTGMDHSVDESKLDQVQIPDIHQILEKYQTQMKSQHMINEQKIGKLKIQTKLNSNKPEQASQYSHNFDNMNASQRSPTEKRTLEKGLQPLNSIKLDKLDIKPQQQQFLQGQGQQLTPSKLHSPPSQLENNFLLSPNVKSGRNSKLSKIQRFNEREQSIQSNNQDGNQVDEMSQINTESNLEDMALMLMSVSDEHFINKNSEETESASSQPNLQRVTKKEMLKLLNRVMDRNKPLFLFNSKHSTKDTMGETGTPSFSMIALIEKN